MPESLLQALSTCSIGLNIEVHGIKAGDTLGVKRTAYDCHQLTQMFSESSLYVDHRSTTVRDQSSPLTMWSMVRIRCSKTDVTGTALSHQRGCSCSFPRCHETRALERMFRLSKAFFPRTVDARLPRKLLPPLAICAFLLRTLRTPALRLTRPAGLHLLSPSECPSRHTT